MTAYSGTDRRSVQRMETNRAYTAEIKLGVVPVHQLKLRDASLNGACILLKEGSSMLPFLSVDQTLTIKFLTLDRTSPAGFFKTAVRHITRTEAGRFRGHYLVGIEILERLSG
jgi:hypothetical protein